MADRKLYAATNENLLAYALEPAMRWLIAVALDGSTITYGELKRKLELEAGFSTVFATRIGIVAGELMKKIQTVDSSAPLINVLVVNQQDRQPSKGAGSFMAYRFGDESLNRPDAKLARPELWAQSFKRAADEAYKVDKSEWAHLFERVFGKILDAEAIDEERAGRQQGNEEDGIVLGRRYGPGGEGPFHKALRIWVKENPASLHRSYAEAATETEVDLDSGDRVDVVYKCIDRTVVIEVKSRISNDIDLRRGVFQCVKYRAVREAMHVLEEPIVDAILVTETKLPGEIAELVKLHNIRHFLAPLDRA